LGGKKPTSGFAGTCPVWGSREVNRQVITPVVAFTSASIVTTRFFAGRKSIAVVKCCCPGLRGSSLEPKCIVANEAVVQSRFGSS